jgi:WD40 repeat protein
MTILDIYNGRLTWAEFIRNLARLEGIEDASQSRPRLRVPVGERDYAVALEAGLGALGEKIARASTENIVAIEIENPAIDKLNADFNLLLGDSAWKLEMRQEAIRSILEEIRLAEFEREARAFRSRAERAYFNGWHEEALADFLEAEKRNYPDFSIHRSIANIYLYHITDLAKAEEYFCKAAKYARPSDARQAAEAHYFAGVVCLIEKKIGEAMDHFREATLLNPSLFEAHYQRACLSAVAGDDDEAIRELESAILGDARYFERARQEAAFEKMRPRVQTLLDGLMEPVEEKLAEARRDVHLREGLVIARPVEEKIRNLLGDIERRIDEARTYRSGLEFLEALSRIQHQLKDIRHFFYRQYQINLNDYVRAVAFSPDGRMLAAGFLHGAIKIWEVYSGLNSLRLEGHLASVNSVSFSPDSQLVASGSRDKTIRLWDAESGLEIQTLEGHAGEVRAASFSPDGEWLVSGSHDRTVRVWRVVTGRQAQILGHHNHQVTSAAFSPTGRWIASGSLDKTIRLWDVTTGGEARTLRGHTKGVQSLAFSPDGRLIASGGQDRAIKVWEVRTGREVQTLTGLQNDVSSLAFSPDGKLLAAGSLGQTVKVWKLDAGQVIKTVRFTEISYNSVAFSPRGQWLALGSRDLQLWLKALLTEEEYAAVREGEERAAMAKDNEEMLALHIFRER